MSTWRYRELACSCGRNVRAKTAIGAHVGRAPHIRAAILDRTFHRFTCSCGNRLELDVPFEYFDRDRRQLILVGASRERDAWRACEDQLHSTVKRAANWGSPLATDLIGRLVPRVVFGLEALREKLVLVDAGLDDAVIECVKLRAIANAPELANGPMRIEQVAPDDALVVRHELRTELLVFPGSWVHAAVRDRESLALRYPEVFGGGFVDLARMWTFEAEARS